MHFVLSLGEFGVSSSHQLLAEDQSVRQDGDSEPRSSFQPVNPRSPLGSTPTRQGGSFRPRAQQSPTLFSAGYARSTWVVITAMSSRRPPHRLHSSTSTFRRLDQAKLNLQAEIHHQPGTGFPLDELEPLFSTAGFAVGIILSPTPELTSRASWNWKLILLNLLSARNPWNPKFGAFTVIGYHSDNRRPAGCRTGTQPGRNTQWRPRRRRSSADTARGRWSRPPGGDRHGSSGPCRGWGR